MGIHIVNKTNDVGESKENIFAINRTKLPTVNDFTQNWIHDPNTAFTQNIVITIEQSDRPQLGPGGPLVAITVPLSNHKTKGRK